MFLGIFLGIFCSLAVLAPSQADATDWFFLVLLSAAWSAYVNLVCLRIGQKIT